MIRVSTDLKAQARFLGLVGQALYQVAGTVIADGIWEEFEQLVYETAQYTGSTAASWNVATKGAGSHGQVAVMGLGPDQEPLQVGHSVAVMVALNRNTMEGNLDDLRAGQKGALTGGINVWNEAPGAEVSQTGPLRSVNDSAIGSFDRFKARVAEKVFLPLAQDYTVEQLVAMAKAGTKL